jgi:hypothetical protein
MTGLRSLSTRTLATACLLGAMALAGHPGNLARDLRAALTQPAFERIDLPPVPVRMAKPVRVQGPALSYRMDLPPLAPLPSATMAEERLKRALTPEMRAHFELFLYVSKANSGPLAQHMYVFRKAANGEPELLYDWPVSTGREKSEITPLGRAAFTTTPRGYYELDPHRFYARYHSHHWDQSMPYTMFFNWERHGYQTGLAIHAAVGDDVAKLGSRASAGCVHLSLDNARTLFHLIRSHYRGPVPRFAVDPRTESMSNQGKLMHDADGNLRMAQGYKVLVFIENYGGRNLVATLF